ncbi:MAG: hypothetical protein JWO82_1501, partial [Akkermansiaceae bacterium]|nr:hypothetical protein [Akkermansiaceae bacterium]
GWRNSRATLSIMKTGLSATRKAGIAAAFLTVALTATVWKQIDRRKSEAVTSPAASQPGTEGISESASRVRSASLEIRKERIRELVAEASGRAFDSRYWESLSSELARLPAGEFEWAWQLLKDLPESEDREMTQLNALYFLAGKRKLLQLPALMDRLDLGPDDSKRQRLLNEFYFQLPLIDSQAGLGNPSLQQWRELVRALSPPDGEALLQSLGREMSEHAEELLTSPDALDARERKAFLQGLIDTLLNPMWPGGEEKVTGNGFTAEFVKRWKQIQAFVAAGRLDAGAGTVFLDAISQQRPGRVVISMLQQGEIEQLAARPYFAEMTGNLGKDDPEVLGELIVAGTIPSEAIDLSFMVWASRSSVAAEEWLEANRSRISGGQYDRLAADLSAAAAALQHGDEAWQWAGRISDPKLGSAQKAKLVAAGVENIRK